MDANVQTAIDVKAPSYDERCDVDQAANSIVAFLIELPFGEPRRFTYCAHHFDRMPVEAKAKVVAKTDLRDFGIFDTE